MNFDDDRDEFAIAFEPIKEETPDRAPPWWVTLVAVLVMVPPVLLILVLQAARGYQERGRAVESLERKVWLLERYGENHGKRIKDLEGSKL